MKSIRASIDESLCVNSGNCAHALPLAFGQRETDGVAFTLADSFDEELRPQLQDVVYMCPGGAISITEI